MCRKKRSPPFLSESFLQTANDYGSILKLHKLPNQEKRVNFAYHEYSKYTTHLAKLGKGQESDKKAMDYNFDRDICADPNNNMRFIIFTMFHVKEATLEKEPIYKVMK